MRWALLAAVLASFVPTEAEACSCMPKGEVLQSELTNARAFIFVGTVERELPVLSEQRPSFPFPDRLLQVRPHLLLRGSRSAQSVEFWSEGLLDCGPALEIGQRYVVFAHRSEDGRLVTGGCSSTAPLFAYGLVFGVLAVLLIAVGASARGLWRLLRRFRRAS